MRNYGKVIDILGFIGMAGAVDTGCGWFASIVLLGIGIIFLTIGSGEKLHKEKSLDRAATHIKAT